jgi:hypothetical protein
LQDNNDEKVMPDPTDGSPHVAPGMPKMFGAEIESVRQENADQDEQ